MIKNYLKLTAAVMASLMVAFTSCNDDDDDDVKPVEDKDVNVISSNITENTTWKNDKIYQLGTRVTVEEGVTLTIEAGTVIKGELGTGTNATALLVARGATLMAEGEADAPIIFTTVGDEITPEDVKAGDIGSPNLETTANGLWGGVIILGSAPISASNDDGELSEVQIEGIPTSDPNGLYGGNEADDNSGVIKYISIRHGGSNIGSGNEINGLTLGGVGTGTTIENVEVVSNQDDGVEWFGGTVNVKNVVSWNVNDDAIDCDQAWHGTLDNFVVIAPADHNFELDGPEGEYGWDKGYTIKNGLVICADADTNRVSADLFNTDDITIANLENIHFTNIQEGQWINRVEHTEGEVNFTDITLDVPEGDLQDFVNGDVPSGVTASSTKPTITGLNWTWASKVGAF